MNRDQFEAEVKRRVLDKLGKRGVVQVCQPPSLSRAVESLTWYMDADDTAYINEQGQFVLESVGDTGNEASRRLSMTIRQVRRGAENAGLTLIPDLHPTTFRVPEDNLFVAVVTFDLRFREALQDVEFQGKVSKRPFREASPEQLERKALGAMRVHDTRGMGQAIAALARQAKRVLGDDSQEVALLVEKAYMGPDEQRKAAIRNVVQAMKKKRGGQETVVGQVVERPFRGPFSAQVGQRRGTMNSFGSGAVSGLAGQHAVREAKANWDKDDYAGPGTYRATYRGFDLMVQRQGSRWVALGQSAGGTGSGAKIGQVGSKELAMDWAERWAERGE